MADADLNCARTFMEKSVVHNIGLNVQHMICMHMYYSSEGKVQRSITFLSRVHDSSLFIVSVNSLYIAMTEGPPYVIAIYSKSTLRPDNA